MEPKSSKKKVSMRSVSSGKQVLSIGEFMVKGGFSLVYFGEVGDEQLPVAVKVIRKEPFLQPGKISRRLLKSAKKNLPRFRKSKQVELPVTESPAQDVEMKAPTTESSVDLTEMEKAEKIERPPKLMSRKDIHKEINSFKQFQENKFVLKLLGTCVFLRETWIITELCVADVSTIFEQIATSFEKILSFNEYGYMIVHFMAPILSALLFIHEKGFVHLDLKPGNILVDNMGVPKLTDFGLCEKLSAETNTFKPKEISGTYYFMAPETITLDPVGPKADAFSFALTCATVKCMRPLEFFFDQGWNYVFDAYAKKPHRLGMIEKTLRKNILDLKFAYTGKSWESIAEDLSQLVIFDEKSRGTLSDLASTQVFKQAIEDWSKYPCAHADLSHEFLRMHAILAKFFGDEGTETLQEFEQHFVIPPKYL